MIELPSTAIRGSAEPVLIDAGFTQRGLTSLLRIARKGTRYGLSCSYGPFAPDEGRVMVQRLISAKQEGLRVPFPLLHSQGSPGTPRLNGSVVTGTALAIDGLTPGYVIKEGYFLSLVKSGQHFVHSVKTGATANGSGQASITLGELLRTDFADNTVVHLATPMIEGIVQGNEWQWRMAADRVIPIEFTIEEVA